MRPGSPDHHNLRLSQNAGPTAPLPSLLLPSSFPSSLDLVCVPSVALPFPAASCLASWGPALACVPPLALPCLWAAAGPHASVGISSLSTNSCCQTSTAWFVAPPVVSPFRPSGSPHPSLVHARMNGPAQWHLPSAVGLDPAGRQLPGCWGSPPLSLNGVVCVGAASRSNRCAFPLPPPRFPRPFSPPWGIHRLSP